MCFEEVLTDGSTRIFAGYADLVKENKWVSAGGVAQHVSFPAAAKTTYGASRDIDGMAVRVTSL
ncbi:hypothetical protein [Burkholderia vietnamiensis]|uniref:hypothetical protein n=1 Tax=Burkholderia vietnamiensis TaxID=60552 RepID=UPI000A5E06CB|nr:hypothetical protein [Burkholderia vietnamiensis]MCA8288178.1 hypothetical protein [Burkholderia vietnamiensis]